MQDLTTLQLDTLLDMLNSQTNEYMKMLKNGSTQEEYAACKDFINRITREIDSRKKRKDGNRNSKSSSK